MQLLERLQRFRDLILPLCLVLSILVILMPMPAAVMDLFLATNITLAVIILLTTIYVGSPLEFSIFPSILVAITLGRLVLNIATTRLILTRTDSEGLSAAGGVIQSFGEFVTGDRMEVGIILFVIIFIIQFVVITKGATRISEVAARFALDGMPGRQMAIDADLAAGAIDEKEAQQRRLEITQQADFFGAMDGASKFVRGDAIAGIIITIINMLGGLYVGYAYAGLSLSSSAELFTKLTIGDGLVSQIPAFLVSLAAAMLVTRSSSKTNLPAQFLQQLFSRPQALAVSAGFLALLMFTQLPTLPLLTLGGGCIGLALLVNRSQKASLVAEQQRQRQQQQQAQTPAEKTVEDYLEVDPMRVELGARNIQLADPARGGDLMKRISTVRATLASEMGMLLPKVRIKDRMSLPEYDYEIQIVGNRVAGGTLRAERLLAIDTGLTTGQPVGELTTDPAFNRTAYWIDSSMRQQAEIYGYQVVQPGAVLATHLQEVARRYGDELLTREVVKQLIDQVKKSNPTIVDELIPAVMKLADVQAVLQALLREDVPIRQMGLILETLGDYAGRIKDPLWLTEYVRHRLARTISHRFRDPQQRLSVITMDPAMEDRVAAGIEPSERGGLVIRMSPAAIEVTCSAIGQAMLRLQQQGKPNVLLVSPRIRPGLRQITQDTLPNLRILSYNEISRDTSIESVGVVSDPLTGGGGGVTGAGSAAAG
jgi:flagellar biosynthesis protein FlhA